MLPCSRFSLRIAVLLTFMFVWDLQRARLSVSRRAHTDSEAPEILSKFGSLGPPGTARKSLRIYDAAYASASMFSESATSALEVGCVKPSFLEHFNWIPNRVCVSPYYAGYSKVQDSAKSDEAVTYLTDDFNEWKQREQYDLVVCMQVIEHVPNPEKTMSKLLESGKVVLVSAPYLWPDCGSKCNHLHHNISEYTIKAWAGKDPVVSLIVSEKDSGARRLISIFLRE
jgi:hypothetical protein